MHLQSIALPAAALKTRFLPATKAASKTLFAIDFCYEGIAL